MHHLMRAGTRATEPMPSGASPPTAGLPFPTPGKGGRRSIPPLRRGFEPLDDLRRAGWMVTTQRTAHQDALNRLRRLGQNGTRMGPARIFSQLPATGV